ncbi:MAG: DUF2780 domain-containing protein [Sumerlaeia bacterium]
MNDLIKQLIEQLNVDEGQAKGGVGMMLQMAKEKLGSGDFSKILDAIGQKDAQDMMNAAPSTGGGGLGGLLGGLASSLGGGKGGQMADMAKLASGFDKLGLDSDMIVKFAPIVISFLQNKGDDGLQKLIANLMSQK